LKAEKVMTSTNVNIKNKKEPVESDNISSQSADVIAKRIDNKPTKIGNGDGIIPGAVAKDDEHQVTSGKTNRNVSDEQKKMSVSSLNDRISTMTVVRRSRPHKQQQQQQQQSTIQMKSSQQQQQQKQQRRSNAVKSK
jgi:hypothetical protein